MSQYKLSDTYVGPVSVSGKEWIPSREEALDILQTPNTDIITIVLPQPGLQLYT